MTTFDWTKDLAHPGKRALKAVNIQLRLLGMDIGADGKQVLEHRVSKSVSLQLNNISWKFSVTNIFIYYLPKEMADFLTFLCAHIMN